MQKRNLIKEPFEGFANSRKSSKSVAFLSTEITDVEDQETSPDPSGLMIEPQSVKDGNKKF